MDTLKKQLRYAENITSFDDDKLKHIDMEYRVAALNKTGQGKESNTVAVVL